MAYISAPGDAELMRKMKETIDNQRDTIRSKNMEIDSLRNDLQAVCISNKMCAWPCVTYWNDQDRDACHATTCTRNNISDNEERDWKNVICNRTEYTECKYGGPLGRRPGRVMKVRLVRPRCFVLTMLPLKKSCFVDGLVCFISLCLLVFVFLNASRRDRNCPTFASTGKQWIHGIRWDEGSE